MEKCRKVVRSLICCLVIIVAAMIGDYFIQEYIYKIRFKVVEDDFSHVFQIDSIERNDNKLLLNGWVFELEKDSIENDFEVILYDYNNDKEYYMDIEDVIREDVNEYFLCEYNYSNSGFVASIKLNKLDLDNTNYEVLIRPKNVRKAYKTSTYISNGEIMFTEPESFVALDVEKTDLASIVNEGVLRVYRPDVGMYVYQYGKALYWVTDESYEFESDNSTYIQYHIWTTQIDKLPKYRLEKKWYFDNLGFYFEDNMLMSVDKFKVVKFELPVEYSVCEMNTGFDINGSRVWRQHFRPWYEFD